MLDFIVGRRRDRSTRKSGRLFEIVVRMANSFKLTFGIYLASLFVASVLFMLLEKTDFIASFYWAFVTSLTLGYGDISPESTPGRILVFFMAHFWIMLILPCLVARIIISTQRDQNQLTHDEQEWMMNALVLIAADLEVELPPQPQDTSFGNIDQTESDPAPAPA